MRKGKGFTLIELLVVIAGVVLLTALLLPTLQRVKKLAKAVACQSNLRQWGTIWVAYVYDNNGRFHDSALGKKYWFKTLRRYYRGRNDLLLCPTASKYIESPNRDDPAWTRGSTFSAWRFVMERATPTWTPFYYVYGSYGTNWWIYQPPAPRDHEEYPYFWGTLDVKDAGNIPVQLDSLFPWTGMFDAQAPPQCDAVPVASWDTSSCCINRHDGGINSLFMDWSVRKVGLKELWTLKWHRKFDTAGPWTKAGGVQPEDWPEWMRNFKDY